MDDAVSPTNRIFGLYDLDLDLRNRANTSGGLQSKLRFISGFLGMEDKGALLEPWLRITI